MEVLALLGIVILLGVLGLALRSLLAHRTADADPRSPDGGDYIGSEQVKGVEYNYYGHPGEGEIHAESSERGVEKVTVSKAPLPFTRHAAHGDASAWRTKLDKGKSKKGKSKS